ncbi:unnamed protein product [Effrenium voratum]|nr:unnamed protein product [Effrenium voratum]
MPWQSATCATDPFEIVLELTSRTVVKSENPVCLQACDAPCRYCTGHAPDLSRLLNAHFFRCHRPADAALERQLLLPLLVLSMAAKGKLSYSKFHCPGPNSHEAKFANLSTS